MTTEQIPFYIRASCEASLEILQERVQRTITLPLDPVVPLPLQLCFRIALLAVNIFLILPVLVVGVAIERTCSFIAHQLDKPVVGMHSSVDPQTNSAFSPLPAETQALTLQNEGIDDLISLSQTCKQWRQQFLYNILPLYINATHMPLHLFKFHPTLLGNILQQIGGKLTYLELTNITSQVAYHWISFCPNLTHLRVNNLISQPMGVPFWWSLHTNWFCPLIDRGILKAEKLTHLSLPHCKLRPWEAEKITTFKNLTALDLYGNTLINESLLALTEPLPLQSEENMNYFPTQLTYLNLGYTLADANYGKFTQITRLSTFKNVTKFNYDYVNLTDNEFSDLIDTLQKFPNLQELSLNCSGVDDARALLIAEKLPNLVSLNLSGNSLEFSGVIKVIESLTQLCEIDISDNTLITIEDLSKIIDQLMSHPDLWNFKCDNNYFPALTRDQLKIRKTQINRLQEHFPHCHIDLTTILSLDSGLNSLLS